ncbi:tRNA lysidine(34) synthetase TilS [Conexibacter sp. CPCC 206217]|uniref:tRNA lysidine(34) synthetase TilS n=1 Tax=Conexibacter sp. CPCC 206217 TaxID=3064574 RepID=UPI0027237213|nr:tRNA lysidine(34) synthetase TilS [Conexibacter sp. CPCC 206217]MDO8209364.1 tRNA lysidine(34) synthetase TilS [Conexibacter sp. CPCC 206217]
MDPDGVVEQIRAGGLLRPGAPVVLLLSGGRDSVCLLDVAARIVGEQAVTALHVNYGLRAEADDDERHCAALCERLGVTFVVRRATPLAGGGNVQAWAREARYAAAQELARALGDCTAIAAGHTADDQVETILYRLASSPSRRALLGMRPRDGRLVRPLLELTRAQTTAYCEARGLGWRDDVTNAGDRYARNRVRHQLVAALREAHPAAEANVLRLAELLRDEADVLDALVDEQFDGETIPLDRLASLAPALRRLVVQRLADAAAGRPVSGAARRADAVAALRRQGTAWLDLGGGVRAVAEYGVLRAELVGERAARTGAGGQAGAGGRGERVAPLPPVVLPIPGAVMFGDWQLRCEASAVAAVDGVLDRAALGDGGALLVRQWRTGDRIAPIGLDGTKSLQDLFTARRVPLARRAALPVVVCGEEIAWIPGVATSARFGVTASTRAAVRLTATGP